MTRRTLRRAGLLGTTLLLLAMGPLAGQALASHFRHGNFNWQKVSGAPAGQQRVTVQYEQSWRADAFGAVPNQGDVITTNETCIDWGDGSPIECLDAVVEFVNAAENYMRVQALAPGSTTNTNVPHDYANPTGTFQTTSTSCCTISELNNANDQTWNILSTIDLANDNQSAVSTIPAIVTLAPGGVRTFNVPAGDAGGQTLFFRLSTAEESCAGCADPHPPGISINSSTGQVTLDTTGLDGLNWTGVVIESRNAQGQVVATSHIQYIIKVATGANQPPVWDSPPTPADGTVFTVAPGESVNFTMQASDPDAGDTVSILKNSGPGTFTPNNGNPATGAFSFTAQSSDLGNDYIVQFIAQDQSGDGPPFRSYTIRVRAATGGTEGPPGDPTCSDGRDNDGDGLTDGADPGCQTQPPPKQCSDGVDNDGDGLIDFGSNPFHNDPDCDSPQDDSESGAPECSDGVDNDGDGLIDFGSNRFHNDPDCDSPQDDSESGAPECSDGVDNDGDGLIDFGSNRFHNDPGCSSAGDPTENGGTQLNATTSTANVVMVGPSSGIARVTLRGRVEGESCAGGKVRLTYRVKGTAPARRVARVRAKCGYRKAIKLRLSGRTTLPATLKISQRFLGRNGQVIGSGRTLRVTLK
jgi:hypothetical protein